MSRPALRPEPDGPTIRSDPDAGTDALARAIWAMGRGQGVRAMEALAAVACNARTVQPGRPLADIVREGVLFPVWNPLHPDHAAMRSVDSNDPAFATALRVVRRIAVSGDPTAGATRFHAEGAAQPDWAAGRLPHLLLAGFCFYRE